MRRFALSLILLLSVAIAGIAQIQAKVPNSRCVGTWTLDTAASDFGKLPPPKSATLHVTKCSADAIAYSYSEVAADGKKYSESWSGKPDGKMTPSQSVPAAPTKNSFTWDRDVLLGKFDMGPEGTAAEHITFSEDGRTMAVKRTGKSPRGDYEMTETWRRKSGISTTKSMTKKPSSNKQ